MKKHDDDIEDHTGMVNSAIRKDIEEEMRKKKYGIGKFKSPSVFRLLKVLLIQQVLLNERKLEDLEDRDGL